MNGTIEYTTHWVLHEDYHTAHCMDVIKNSLQCNADLMLGATTDLNSLDFGLGELHQCVDFTALIEWMRSHEWKGFPQWYGQSL